MFKRLTNKTLRQALFRACFVVLFVVATALGFAAQNAKAAAGIPLIINYQARVTNATGTPIAAATNMRFVIWDSLTGGSCVWSGWGTGGSNGCSSPNGSQVSVTPINGVFSIALGDTTVSSQNALQNTIFNDDSRYLEIQMYNGTTFETLGPRKRILAAPYAMNSNMLAGLLTSASGGANAFVPVTDSSGKLTLTAGTTVSGALVSLNDTSNFNTQINTGTSTGTVTIGNTGYAGAVGILSHAALTLTAGATSTWSTSAGDLTLAAAAGNMNLNVASGNTLSIGGNAVAKTISIGSAAGANVQTISIGTNTAADVITIGTTTASEQLILNSPNWSVTSAGIGTFAASSKLGTDTFTANTITDSGALTIHSASGSNLTLDSAGGTSIVNVGTTNATTVAIGRTGQATQLKGVTTVAANGVLYIKDTNGGIEETAASTGAQCLQTSGSGTAPIWGPCGGGGARLDQIGAATTTATIANANNAIVWNWGSLTSQIGLTLGGGSAMTTGKVLWIDPTYVHTAAETGESLTVTTTDASTITGALTSTTNGVDAEFTINSPSGTGTKIMNAFASDAPTLTNCAAGTCTYSGFNAYTQATGAASTITQNGVNITALGIGAGTLNGINIGAITGGAGTENAIAIGGGWDNSITTLANADLNIYPNGTGSTVIKTDADSFLKVTAAGVPGQDMVQITNAGQPVVAPGVSGIQLTYAGGAAAVEASAERIDLTGGTTAGGTWNGLRVVQGTITPGTTVGDVKFETAALSQSASVTTNINGIYMAANAATAGALTTTAGTGTINWTGVDLITPNIYQFAGTTILSDGMQVTTGGIAYGGTQNGVDIIGQRVDYGTLNGINIRAITGGAGTETALNIGTGWDTGLAIATANSYGSGLVITTAGGGTATAFSVGANGIVGPAFNVDTTANAVNYVTNPSFEVDTTGWAAKGTNPTISRVTTQAAVGGASLYVNNTAGSPAAGDGVKYNYFFYGGYTYTLSFYAKLAATSTFFSSATAPYNDFAAGYYSGTADTDCTLSPSQDQQAVTSTQWTRYSCTIATVYDTNQYFYIRQTDNMAGHAYYIDGVQLEAASQPTTYREGTVSFGASLLKAQGLKNCDRLTTDATGTIICGNGVVNSIPLVVGFGHSVMRALYAATNGASNGYNRYLARLANLLHAQEINHAVDAAQSYLANNVGGGGGYAYMLQNTIPPRNQVFAPGQTGPTAPYLGSNNLGVLQYGINDVYLLTANSGAGTAYNSSGCNAYNWMTCTLEDSKEAMRTMIAREQASAVFEEDTNNSTPTTSPTSVFYSGTNTHVLTTAQNSGAGYQQFTTAGSATICLPLDLNATGGTVDVGILADTSGNGATHTITLDGTTVATVNTIGLLNKSGIAGTTATNLSIVRRIQVPPGNASGTTGCLVAGTQHKIVDNITLVTGSTGFDYYQIEATTPVPTLVVNTARQANYSYQGNTINDKDVIAENAAMDDVISEFPPTVMSVDEDTALNKNPDNWSTDLVHPNDKGHALIAEAAYKTLLAMPGDVRQTTMGLAAGNTTQTIETINYGIYNTDYQPTLLINTTPTSPGNVANSITNPGFEFDSSGWGVFIGSINRVTTQNYTGTGSLQVVTNPAAPLSGPYWNWAFPDTNPFTFSFYAKLDAASPAFTTLAAGYYDSGSVWHACSLNSNTVVATGWTRYYCTFSTTSGSVFPSIVDSSSGAGAKTFYIDDVLLQETSTLNNWDEGGSISLVGNVVSPVQFQNTSNSTTAFQINDATGNVLMSANTVTDNVSFTTIGLAQTTTAVTTLNPVSVSATGAISQATNTGTINWLGNLITTPTTTINVAGGTILNDGLKIVQGIYNVNTTNGAAGGMNGIDIAGGTMSTTAGQTGTISDINLTTALLASSTTGVNNVNGIYLSSAGAISTGTTNGAVNWDGIIMNPPTATVGYNGSTVTSNGFDINASNLTMSANGTGNVYGIDLAMGTLTANGTGGVMDGILIAGPAIAGTSTNAGTVNDEEIKTAALSLSTATTQNIYGWNLSAAGNITTTSTGMINWTGANIVMPNITQGASSTIISNGLSLTGGTITTGGTENAIKINNTVISAGTGTAINIGTGWTNGIQFAGAGTINTAGGATTSAITLTTGISTAGVSGALNLNTGNATAGASGAIAIASGTTTTSGTTGNITIASGAPVTATLASGAVTINSGNVSGAVAPGTVTLDVGTGGNAGILNIGTSALAKTITIGASSGSTVQTINIGGAGTGVNAISIGNNAAASTIAIGSASAGNSSFISNGTLTFTAAAASTWSTTGASSDLSITSGSTATTALNLDTATTGQVNIGSNASAKTINIGVNAAGVKTIAIGTGAVADTITIGSATAGASSFKSNAALTLTAGATSVWSTSAGDLSITSGSTAVTALNIDTATTGQVNIGSNASAKTINIGVNAAGVKTIAIGTGAVADTISMGSTSAGAISMNTASTFGLTTTTGTQTFTSAVASTVTTASGFSFVDNALTSGTMMNISTSNAGITAPTANQGAILNVNASSALTNVTNSLISFSASALNTSATGSLLNLFIGGNGTVQAMQDMVMTNNTTATTTTMMTMAYPNITTNVATNKYIVFTANSGVPQGTIAKGTSSGTVSYANGSDRRIKHDIVDTHLTLSDLMKIKVRDFVMNQDTTNQVQSGFIAQELNTVYPQAVLPNGDDGVGPLGRTDMPWAIDYGRVTPIIIKGVQDQQNLLGGFTATGDDLSAFVAGVQAEAPRDVVSAFNNDIANSKPFLTDFSASRVTALRGYFDETYANKSHQASLCVGDAANGGETCITKEQLDKLLADKAGNGVAATGTVGPDATSNSSTAPVQISNNNNPVSNVTSLSGLVVNTDLNMVGFSISNVLAISGTNNQWSIDANGLFAITNKVDDAVSSLYAMTGVNTQVILSGSGQLQTGHVRINFTKEQKNVMAKGIGYQVSVTVTDSSNGVYVPVKNADGFDVDEVNGGTSGTTFDWMVIARRNGYENANDFGLRPDQLAPVEPAPTPIPTPVAPTPTPPPPADTTPTPLPTSDTATSTAPTTTATSTTPTDVVTTPAPTDTTAAPPDTATTPVATTPAPADTSAAATTTTTTTTTTPTTDTTTSP